MIIDQCDERRPYSKKDGAKESVVEVGSIQDLTIYIAGGNNWTINLKNVITYIHFTNISIYYVF